MRNLLPGHPSAARLAGQVMTLGEFLSRAMAGGYTPPPLRGSALLHGHCHHKSIMRLEGEKEVLRKMQLDFRELDSGCCGMAGSFGYEEDKYELSVACGERVLLPEARRAELSAVLIADGFSCKQQIAQQTQRHALHLAEVIQLAQEHGPAGPGGRCPEEVFVRPRQEAVRKSMKRAALGVALAAGVVAGLAWALRR
jgi:Fe-S oxidoreductase